MKKTPLLCLLITLLLVSTIDSSAQEDGFVDLSKRDIHVAPVDLSGKWEFYYHQLLSPQDFNGTQVRELVSVPGSWHRQGNYDVLGYATYRLRLKLSDGQHGLSLYFPVINSSSKVWINGELAGVTGLVSADRVSYKPKLGALIVAIPGKVADVEIIVQVANYSYYSGGIAGVPELAETDAILARINRRHGLENFFAGALLAMFVYQVMLYFLHNRGKPNLWLALICLGVALRALIVHGGSFLLPGLYPSVEWEVWKKIEFGSVYAIAALFPLYVYHLFPEAAPRKPLILFVGLSAMLCLSVLVTTQPTYGQLLEVCHVMLLAAFIYAVYAISRAWRAGNKDARIILFGVLASFPFIFGEIIKNSYLDALDVEFMYLVEMGVLVFLLFQVYLLANHYAKSYRSLESLNQRLEKVVTERTGELTAANTVKDRLLSVMSHDVKSPLSSLRGLLQMYNRGTITKEEFAKFTLHIESDLSKTSLLVENILYWTASQIKGVQVKLEKFDLSNLIEENYQLFNTIAADKKLVLNHQVAKGMMIRTDRSILNFVIRNLVANAIKYSFEGGEITILAGRENGMQTIQVKDRGVGMDEATMHSLLKPQGSWSTSGTGDEMGTGLGVALCSDYLQKVSGQLSVDSSKEHGSTFSVLLPAD